MTTLKNREDYISPICSLMIPLLEEHLLSVSGGTERPKYEDGDDWDW